MSVSVKGFCGELSSEGCEGDVYFYEDENVDGNYTATCGICGKEYSVTVTVNAPAATAARRAPEKPAEKKD